MTKKQILEAAEQMAQVLASLPDKWAVQGAIRELGQHYCLACGDSTCDGYCQRDD